MARIFVPRLANVAHLKRHHTFYCTFWNKIRNLCTGVLISPEPDLLPDVYCFMVRIFPLMLVLLYTGCHRRNGPNFGRVFLMLKYTDITQNTYIQS